jgi:hypothetical protein
VVAVQRLAVPVNAVFRHNGGPPETWTHEPTGVQVRRIETTGRSFFTVWMPTPTGEVFYGTSSSEPGLALDLARELVGKIERGEMSGKVLS